jgi:hypothetical protein
MYVSVYVCVCIYTHTYIYTHHVTAHSWSNRLPNSGWHIETPTLSLCIHLSSYTYICMYVCMYVCMYKHIHMYIPYGRTQLVKSFAKQWLAHRDTGTITLHTFNSYTYICMYIHMYVHIYTYIPCNRAWLVKSFAKQWLAHGNTATIALHTRKPASAFLLC